MPVANGLVEYVQNIEASGSRPGKHAGKIFAEAGGTVGVGNGWVYAHAADYEEGDLRALTCTDAVFNLLDHSFTVACWFLVESLATSGNSRTLIDKGTAGTFEFRLRCPNTGGLQNLQMGVNCAGGAASVNSASTLGILGWHFGVGWYDSINDLVWVQLNDGTPDSVASSGASLVGTGVVSLGGTSDLAAAGAHDGMIGPVMFWNRILTSAERTELYNNGDGLRYRDFYTTAGTLKRGLTEYLKINEGSGTFRYGSHSAMQFSNGGSQVIGSGTGLVYASAGNFENNGVDTQVLIRTDRELDMGDNKFTAAVWFNVEDWPAEGFGYGVLDKDSTITSTEWRLFVFVNGPGDTNRNLSIANTAVSTGVTDTNLEAATWYLGFIWYDPQTDLLWVQLDNGTPVSVFTGGTMITANGPFHVGNRSLLDHFQFDGQIGPAVLWNRILSSAERTQVWNNGAGLPYEEFAEEATVIPRFARSRRRR